MKKNEGLEFIKAVDFMRIERHSYAFLWFDLVVTMVTHGNLCVCVCARVFECVFGNFVVMLCP